MRHHDDSFPLSQARCTRRTMLRSVAGAAAVGAAWPLAGTGLAAEARKRIKQSVCLWCYDDYLRRTKMSLDRFAAACAKMGLRSIELTTPDQWPTLKKHGLICAMSVSHGIPRGLNHLEYHAECLAAMRKSIDATAAAGFPNVVTLSGNRAGMDDQEGLKNCVIGLKKIAGYAERKKVTVCLELLNSIDHRDYMGDSTKWCVAAIRQTRLAAGEDPLRHLSRGNDEGGRAGRHPQLSRVFCPLSHRRRPGATRNRQDTEVGLCEDHPRDCRHRLRWLHRPGVRSCPA